ncbi:MAG: hypothetical protein A2147_05165 [Chloroflexi bacterium RBG_16_57_8]|nr:MAG: hypothetical protein A2147_05165 [Chloroflexi bacterium RBG_16_57_8]
MLDVNPDSAILFQLRHESILFGLNLRSLRSRRFLLKLLEDLKLLRREEYLHCLSRADPNTAAATGALGNVEHRLALGVHFDGFSPALSQAARTAGNALTRDEASGA